MKFFAATAALVSVVPHIMAMTINTPMSVVQCQPVLFTWSEGSGPYYLSLIPGGQPSAAAYRSFDKVEGSSLTYVVDMAAGTGITAALKDSTGATAFTDVFTVQKSSDASCLNGASPNAGSTGSAAATTQAADPAATSIASAPAAGSTTKAVVAAPSSGTARPTSINAAVSTSRVLAASSTSSGSAASATKSSGAESRANVMSYGVAGLLGLVGAMAL